MKGTVFPALFVLLASICLPACKKDKIDAKVIGEYMVAVTSKNVAPPPIGSSSNIIDSNKIVSVKAKEKGEITFVDGNTKFSLRRQDTGDGATNFIYVSENLVPYRELKYYSLTGLIEVTNVHTVGISHSGSTIWAGYKIQ